MALYTKITNQTLQFPAKAKDRNGGEFPPSEHLKDLILRMLTKDPAERITVQKIKVKKKRIVANAVLADFMHVLTFRILGRVPTRQVARYMILRQATPLQNLPAVCARSSRNGSWPLS
jgi:hypothetical protein